MYHLQKLKLTLKISFARKFSTEPNIDLYNQLFKCSTCLFHQVQMEGWICWCACFISKVVNEEQWIFVLGVLYKTLLDEFSFVYCLCSTTPDLIETQIKLLCFLQCDWLYKKLEKGLQLLFTFFDITNT